MEDAAPLGFATLIREITMRALRLLLASSLIAASLLAAPASATSYSTDQSDLWFIPSESGWGIQLVQRGSTIFATMFVYDAAGNPIWYVATMTPPGGGLTWTGDLLVGTGPWFGAVPFNPAMVSGRKVGSMSWAPSTVSDGMLNYAVDGIAVSKHIIRQPLVNEDYSGRFGFGLHSTISNCFNAANNGTFESVGLVDVSQNGNAVTMNVSNADSCTYSGTLSQAGQLGTITGNYVCASRDGGNFTLFEVQVTPSAIGGRYVADSLIAGCHSTGWFGGARTTLF